MRIASMLSAMITAVVLGGQASGASFEMQIVSDQSIRSGEPEVVVNPRNPKNLAYYVMTQRLPYSMPFGATARWDEKGYIDCHLAVSFDRGRTWESRPNPVMTGRVTLCGDPMLAFGPDGTLYAAADAMYIDPNNPKVPGPMGEVEVTRSLDGGRNWGSPIVSGTPIDRPFLMADASDGTLYITSSCANPPGSYCEPATRYLIASRDKGLTWSNRVPLDSSEFPSKGAGSISAAHGWLAVAYVSAAATGKSCPCLVFARTKDAGASWARSVVPAAAGIGEQAQVVADPKRPGGYAIVVQSADRVSFQIYVSLDGGRTWTPPTTVANEPRKVGFKSWASYSPDGVLGIFWRAYEAPPEDVPVFRFGSPSPMKTFPYTIWGAISRDGGKVFSRPLQLSQTPSPAADAKMLGGTDDLSFMVLDHTDAHYAWGDWRSGDLQAWYGRTPLADFGP
jgi:BNR repeat-like domain